MEWHNVKIFCKRLPSFSFPLENCFSYVSALWVIAQWWTLLHYGCLSNLIGVNGSCWRFPYRFAIWFSEQLFSKNEPLGKYFLFSKASWRRLQRNSFSSSKTSWRRLQEMFAKCLAKMSSRRLRKTSSKCLQDVLQLCFEEVLQAPWRRLGRQENVTLKASRRLQDVFIASSPRRMIAWEAVSSNRTVQLFF